MESNDGISEIYQILSNLLINDLQDMFLLTKEQCSSEGSLKIYEDLLKSLLKINNERELESFHANMVAINRIGKFDEKFYKSLSTAFSILERVANNTLSTAKKCVQNFENLQKMNVKSDQQSVALKVDLEITPSSPKILRKALKRTSSVISTPLNNKPNAASFTTEEKTTSTNVQLDKILDSIEKLPSGTFKCTFCPFGTSNSKKDLRTHMINHWTRQSSTPSYKCKYCDYYLLTSHSIQKHEQLHEIGEEKSNSGCKFACKNCPYTTNSVEHFGNHSKNHIYREGTTKCRFCNYYVMTNIYIHERIHEQKKASKNTPQETLSLDASFRGALTSDNNSCHLYCQKCPYKTSSEHDMEVHMKSHKFRDGCLKCRYCDYYSVELYLKSHEISHPEYEPDNQQPESSTGSSGDASTSYDKEDQADNIKRRKVVALSPNDTSQDLFKTENNIKKCTQCPFQTKSSFSITEHVKNHNFRADAKKCRYCDYYLFSKISKHELVHPEYEPNPVLLLKCKICPWTTTTIRRMELHTEHHSLTSAKFKCRYCQYFTFCEENLNNHEKFHPDFEATSAASAATVLASAELSLLNINRFKQKTKTQYTQCKFCPYKPSANNLRDMRQHMVKHKYHDGYKKCKQCNYWVEPRLAYLLKKHEKLHENSQKSTNIVKSLPNYKCCKICPFKGRTLREFRVHMNKHKYREACHKCRFCDFYIQTKFHLLIHEKLHPEYIIAVSNDDHSQVNHCITKKIEDQEEEQENNEENQNAAMVDMPSESSLSSSSTKSHHTCHICPYSTKYSHTMDEHLSRHDPQNFSASAKKCKSCSFRTDSLSVLYHHQKLHVKRSQPLANAIIENEPLYTNNNNNNNSNNNSSTSSNSTLAYSCEICPFKCVNKNQLDSHRQRHEYTEDTRKCKYCEYYCEEEDHLAQHEMLHSVYAGAADQDTDQDSIHLSLTCKYCPYKPANGTYLERHMQRHQFKENTKKCKFCPYYTSNNKNMRRHENKHNMDDCNATNDNQSGDESSGEPMKQSACEEPQLVMHKQDCDAQIIANILEEIIDEIVKNE
jgi:hypothetical protein